MLLILLIPMIILLLSFKKSKVITFFGLLYMWIVFGFNSKNPDRSVYEDRYNLYDSWFDNFTEPLFTFSMKTFNAFHFHFQSLYLFVGAFFLLSTFIYIAKTTKNANFVLGLILISTYAMHVVLIRTTYAIIFEIPALYVLLYEKFTMMRRLVIFFTLTIIACLIHAMCALYLLLLIPFFISRKKLTIYLWLIFPLIFIMLDQIGREYLPHIMNKLGFIQKTEMVLERKSSNKTIAFLLANLRLLSVTVFPILYNWYNNHRPAKYKIVLSSVEIRIININIFMLCLIPLLYISLDLYRLLYIICIVNFCMISNHLKEKGMTLCSILYAMNIGYWFIWRPYFHDVIVTVFSNNFLTD